MEREIIDIKKEEGEIYLSCRCIKPILGGEPWAGDITNAEANYEQRNAKYKIAMTEYRRAIGQIHLGEYELTL